MKTPPWAGKVNPRRHRINASSFAKMMAVFLSGPATVYEAAEVCGLHTTAVRRYVLAMYDEGVLFIAGWEEDKVGRRSIKSYALNLEGKADVPKPKAKTKAQHSKDWRARRKLARQLNILRT